MLKINPVGNLGQAAQRIITQANEGQRIAYPAGRVDGRTHVTLYLNWVRNTEAQLRNIFSDPSIPAHLRSDAYWFILVPANADVRVSVHIEAEASEQAEWLQRLARGLTDLDARLRGRPGDMAVLDTNVLLHYQTPEYVDWLSVLATPAVRLVLPLRVIEELDEKKFLSRPPINERARSLLSQLWAKLGPTSGGPVQIRVGVTIEVPIEDEPRDRRLSPDSEVLDLCGQFVNAGRQELQLVTADTGMSLRGVAAGIRVMPMPDAYLR